MTDERPQSDPHLKRPHSDHDRKRSQPDHDLKRPQSDPDLNRPQSDRDSKRPQPDHDLNRPHSDLIPLSCATEFTCTFRQMFSKTIIHSAFNFFVFVALFPHRMSFFDS